MSNDVGGSGRSNGSENEGRDDRRETREDTDSGDELKRFVPADAAWDVAAERTEDTGDLPVKWQRELQAAAEEADDRSTVREQVLADVRAHFDRDELEAYDFDRDDLATYEAEGEDLARFEFGGDDHAAAEEDER
jgi:hypothetical protein